MISKRFLLTVIERYQIYAKILMNLLKIKIKMNKSNINTFQKSVE